MKGNKKGAELADSSLVGVGGGYDYKGKEIEELENGKFRVYGFGCCMTADGPSYQDFSSKEKAEKYVDDALQKQKPIS